MKLYFFIIGDVPAYFNTTSHYDESAPDADIDFSANPKAHLDILIDTLIDMIKITYVSKMVFLMNE